MPDKDTLWWENYDEVSDYQQLMQEEIGEKKCIVCEEECRKVCQRSIMCPLWWMVVMQSVLVLETRREPV